MSAEALTKTGHFYGIKDKSDTTNIASAIFAQSKTDRRFTLRLQVLFHVGYV